MGQMIPEEECPVCEEFDQQWIFTYGDLVTLLLCFFILLFSMCVTEIEKFDEVSDSFKPSPPGSPFVHQGKKSLMDEVSEKLEKMDMPDDVSIAASAKGVEISFRENVVFQVGSAELSEEAKKAMEIMLPLLSGLPNLILIEGHTDESETGSQYSSSWELSIARASKIALFFEEKNIRGERIQIAGYGNTRPRFFNDTAYKRSLNRRVNIILLPEDQER